MKSETYDPRTAVPATDPRLLKPSLRLPVKMVPDTSGSEASSLPAPKMPPL